MDIFGKMSDGEKSRLKNNVLKVGVMLLVTRLMNDKFGIEGIEEEKMSQTLWIQSVFITLFILTLYELYVSDHVFDSNLETYQKNAIDGCIRIFIILLVGRVIARLKLNDMQWIKESTYMLLSFGIYTTFISKYIEFDRIVKDEDLGTKGKQILIDASRVAITSILTKLMITQDFNSIFDKSWLKNVGITAIGYSAYDLTLL
jgi:hypothetical protein